MTVDAPCEGTCYQCVSTDKPPFNSGAFLRVGVNGKTVPMCMDSGCTYTTLSERLCTPNTIRLKASVRNKCASGVIEKINQYGWFILSVAPGFNLETRALIAPDKPGTPDLLLGRDTMREMRVTLDLTNSLAEISGSVVRLQPSPEACLKNEPYVYPSLTLTIGGH